MKLDQSISAIVTGASSGLGEATARTLADAGVKVTIFDMNSEMGEKVAENINGHFEAVDISDSTALEKAFEGARQKHGTERILVNCAGICPGAKTTSRGAPHDPALFAKTIAINLTGTFLTSSQSATAMAECEPLETGERGVIINTSSIAAYEGQIGQIAYATSKGGVVAMTFTMARDLAKLGIRVNSIAPGIFKTPMVAGLPQEVQDALGANIPFPSRLGAPAEFAGLARHIIENNMINGETIRIDGAFRMPPK